MTDLPRCAIVLPCREDGGHRDRLWKFCRAWWEQLGWQIIEGHHDEGLFNRGAAINAAAAQVDDVDVILVMDRDVLAPLSQVRKAAAAAFETGRATFAFDRYAGLNREMTERILTEDFRGDWRPGVELWLDSHVSSILAVPVDLWMETRGFDERIEGWGYDDLAFYGACKNLRGDVDNVPGFVWHLWHPTAPENTKGHPFYRATPEYRAGRELAARYDQDGGGQFGIRQFLGEDRGPDQVVAVVLTTGTRDTLPRTIESFDRQVRGPIGRRVIVVDGPARPDFPGWDVVNLPGGPNGFTQAMRSATRIALGSGQPWVFWCEDDFTFDEPVDLADLQAEMLEHPDLLQLSLMRQAWFPAEIEAGGIIQRNPGGFAQRDGHVVHREYWTTNPHLTTRMTLARYPWPNVRRWSEQEQGRRMFADEVNVVGVWGDGTPTVTHIGEQRTGLGY